MKWGAVGLVIWTLLPPRSQTDTQPYQLLRALPQPNPEFLTKQPRSIAVVGGGIAGCITAKCLLQQGYQVRVFEQNQTGDCTDSGSLPDFPRKEEKCGDYLQRFKDHFGLDACVHMNCRVTGMNQQDNGSWSIHTNQGTYASDFLVVATGFQPEQTPVRQERLPVYTENDIPDLQGKEVLVLGSAGDIAPYLTQLRRLHSVTCVIPEHDDVGLPSLLTSILAHTRFSAYLQRSHRGVSDYMVRAMDMLLTRLYTASWPANTPPSNSFVHSLSQVETGADFSGLKVIRGTVEVTDTEVRVGDTVIPCDAIVIARKHVPGMGLIPSNTQGLYRNSIFPGLRNAVFIGQFKSQERSLLTSLQAKWVVDVLRGRVVLPSFAYMHSHPLSWKCSAYEAADVYVQDCGLKRYRRSWAEEFLLGISSANYAEVMTHSR